MNTAKDQLHITSKQFTRSLVFVLVSLWALLQIYVAQSDEERIRNEVGIWISHNKTKIEEYLFVENTLALNGLFQTLIERLTNKQVIQRISVVLWDGNELVVYPADSKDSSGKSNISFQNMNFKEDLKFADRNLGVLHVQARRDISRMIFDSGLVAAVFLTLFSALIYLRNILISEVEKTLVRPIQLLRTQMKSGLVLDLGIADEEKKGVWAKEALELDQSYVELINRLTSITKQRESEAKLIAAGEVAARVAHDIRSPLMALEIAAANMKSASPEVVDLITQANKRIRDIASKLFAQARSQDIEADADELSERMNSAIESLIAEKSAQFSERLQSGKVQLKRNIGPMTKPINLEPDEVARLVSNLLDNAIEAVGEQGYVELDINTGSTGLNVRISDSGAGIPETIIGRLGEPGFTFAKKNGSGYGLFSVKRAIESCGGALKFHSSPGHGTTVMVSIPFA